MHFVKALCFDMQEIIILIISTVYWDEERLSALNIAGMVVCVAGIAFHVVQKALKARSELSMESWMS